MAEVVATETVVAPAPAATPAKLKYRDDPKAYQRAYYERNKARLCTKVRENYVKRVGGSAELDVLKPIFGKQSVDVLSVMKQIGELIEKHPEIRTDLVRTIAKKFK